ncbi:DUF998 domain-containing protein [Streptomyces cavernicola]|uniref:DUF998 domain-containing protein n=1 Tax=Streptomyces cavernicola TaxID=3043613 RepID=A0ABT6SCQ2_9ACTN|nr:DUF998 domain-containing protein [Streptomyces sp. B-S-A6]MDI3405980.1 DUF998 domain-containing protein [Streptomyces sp. B-S-A6]
MSSHERIRTLRAARVVAAALLGLGALAYTAWALEAVLATGLDPIRTYVSELAAESEPLGGLFRATDLVAGLLVCAGAAWSLARLAPHTPWFRVGWAGLLLFGAATAVDSRLPLSCTPTADPECAARETAGLVPATHTAHAISSSLAVTGALIGMVVLTAAARRHRTLPALARLGPWLVGLELAVTLWTLSSVAAFQAGHGTWLLGLGQRAQVALIAGWLALLAYALARRAEGWVR